MIIIVWAKQCQTTENVQTAAYIIILYLYYFLMSSRFVAWAARSAHIVCSETFHDLQQHRGGNRRRHHHQNNTLISAYAGRTQILCTIWRRHTTRVCCSIIFYAMTRTARVAALGVYAKRKTRNVFVEQCHEYIVIIIARSYTVCVVVYTHYHNNMCDTPPPSALYRQ